MTTIAFRDGVIAADTGVKRGSLRSGKCVKIARNEHGDLAGGAGILTSLTAFLNWFENDEKGAQLVMSEDTVAFVFRARTDELEMYDSDGSFRVSDLPYYAIGSGSPIAYGAMHAGATAEGAVKAAIEHLVK